MEFTVSVDFGRLVPVTDEQIGAVADIGGPCAYGRDRTTVGATMTVDADDALTAGRIAIDRVAAIVGAGRVVGVEALTVEEFDRRFDLV